MKGSTRGFFVSVTLMACRPHVAPLAPDPDANAANIQRDIVFLASDALEGRLTGTPGNDSAAAYIARRYRAMKLRAPVAGYVQAFDALSAEDAHLGRTAPRHSQNVVAVVDGSEPRLRGQYIVVGAHYDHLGRSSDFALDPEAKDAIRNGADDNASGTAAVMELARMFKARPAKRSVMFVNFSGEELGLLGSHWFAEHAPAPLDSVPLMVNFDMVGRLRDNKLIVYGRGTAKELASMVDSVNNTVLDAHFSISGSDDGFGPSDHSSFYAKDVPVLHFFTDIHDDYHRATDDADKINSAGEARVVDLAAAVIRAAADREARPTFVRMAPPARTMTTREGAQVYLGSVPDMAAANVPGLKLTGVRPGSPADLAGLKAGDIVVELGGVPVKDLYAYSEALYAHKPGDKIAIVVVRDGKRIELTATLGRRGG
jgi:Zn-dependent M28 family amino/carboxypeptidase